jgi:LEA14-like dessication related protein
MNIQQDKYEKFDVEEPKIIIIQNPKQDNCCCCCCCYYFCVLIFLFCACLFLVAGFVFSPFILRNGIDTQFKDYKVNGFRISIGPPDIKILLDTYFSIKNNGYFTWNLDSTSYTIYFESEKLLSSAKQGMKLELSPNGVEELTLKVTLDLNDISYKFLQKIYEQYQRTGKLMFKIEGNFEFSSSFLKLPMMISSKDVTIP